MNSDCRWMGLTPYSLWQWQVLFFIAFKLCVKCFCASGALHLSSLQFTGKHLEIATWKMVSWGKVSGGCFYQAVEQYWLSGYQVSVYCKSWVFDICFSPLEIVKERLCRFLKTTIVFHLFIHTPMMSRSGKTDCSEVISQFGQKLGK